MFGFLAPLQSVSRRKGLYPQSDFSALRIGVRLSLALSAVIFLSFVSSVHAVILWNDPETTLVRENGLASDILGGALKRDDFANDSLYFKFHVEPRSDKDTEEYFAAFELFEGNVEKLGVGNALKAWAYSAFFRTSDSSDSNSLPSYIDLHSANPESTGSGSYQYPRRGIGATVVFKVQFIPGEDDLVTIWLNPDLSPGANEASQAENLTTRFNANASFDEIRLRHGGQGGGWSFSDLAIATSFTDFVDFSSSRPGEAALDLASGVRAFSFQSWQKEEGLTQRPARVLTQTRDGYIWIGTDEGLVRFDGLRFVPFGISDGMKGAPVTTLLQDHRGVLWIGTADNGLSYWQDDRFTTLTKRDGLPANSITALVEDNSGRVWIGTDAGLATWQNGHLSLSNATAPIDGLRINALLKDQKGTIWASVKNAGIFHLTSERFVTLTGESVEDVLKEAHCLLVDHAGRLWLGAGEDIVLCRDNERWYQYRIPRHEAKSHITSLAEEPDGTVWAGSSGGGLIQFKDGKSAAVPAETGLAGSLVQSLLTDREGHLWVGTESGLNRLRRKPLTVLSQSEGLGLGAVHGMAEVMPGIIWVAKANNGLYRWDRKSFNRLSATGLSPHDSQIATVLVTHEGSCWVATTNSLLLYKDPIAAADEVKVMNSSNLNIVALAEDREGALWAGTREGTLWRLREGAWLAQTNFSQTNSISGIVPEADDSVWIGTDGNGLFRLAKGNVEHFDRSGPVSKQIRTLFLDARETLWVGTAAGLSRLRHGRVANFTTREGLPDNYIVQIVEDDFGRLWLGTAGGIACVNKTQLEDVASGKISRLYPQIFGRAEGMLSEECSGGFFPTGLKTRSGLLWFSTSKGVCVINPRFQPVETAVPNPVLEEVTVDDVPNFRLRGPSPPVNENQTSKMPKPDSANSLRIRPGKHRVEFRFTGLSYDAPELIRFRYRLEELDPDWVEAGTRRSAFYSYLPPGSYRFHLAVCNNNGAWSESESSLGLFIPRHFWQTWWFITLAVVGSAASVIVIVHITEKTKLHSRLKRVEQERALESERTRIAKDLHDEMGAKLCRISFLSEHASRNHIPPQELRQQITSISDASRELLHSLDEIVWAVNPQNDTLEHVASYMGQYAQEYFQMTGIQCELDIPTQVPPHPLSSQMRHHLFLATHEALTNILKHSGATRAVVCMVLNKAGFEIKISDNGKGLVPTPVNSSSGSPGTDSGDGLSNMRKRLADIGGQCSIDSSPGQGTNIRFVIPLNSFNNGH
jgi:ligand-binding sensor domain-containing protein/signal transduction histidine kinase